MSNATIYPGLGPCLGPVFHPKAPEQNKYPYEASETCSLTDRVFFDKSLPRLAIPDYNSLTQSLFLQFHLQNRLLKNMQRWHESMWREGSSFSSSN